jgi:nucleoside-diphosphate-sugar epimerase
MGGVILKVLLIGGTGHISQSIVNKLLQDGHEIACFNRGMTGVLPTEVSLILGDKTDRKTFEETMRNQQFDAVIDMICFNREDAASNLRAFPDIEHLIHVSTACTYGTEYNWLPVSEDHPIRPVTDYGRGKAEADRLYLETYYRDGYPVTIIKPSTTYGSKIGMLRQIAWDFSWIDRVKKGKPIAICGDGKALHQFLHVDDAAKGFSGVLGKKHCMGQSYNLVNRGFTTWEDYHRLAMKVLDNEVELIGVSLQDLIAINSEKFAICHEIFAHNCYYSPEKLFRDVPEFRPEISLEAGMRQVFGQMEQEGTIPNSDPESWEDEMIAAQKQVRKTILKG